MMDFLARAVASGFFVGRIPIAPATFGSVWAVLLVMATGSWGPAYWSLALLLLPLSVLTSSHVSGLLLEKDPKEVVIDEIVSLYLAYATFPLTWKTIIAGFLLFRLYDVIKPFPARRLENLPHGYGIVADDLVAGAYTWLTLYVLLRLGFL